MQVSVRNVADAFERDVSTCSIASEFFLRRFFSFPRRVLCNLAELILLSGTPLRENSVDEVVCGQSALPVF